MTLKFGFVVKTWYFRDEKIKKIRSSHRIWDNYLIYMNTKLRVSRSYWSQLKYALLMPVCFFVSIFVTGSFSFDEVFTIGDSASTSHLLLLSVIMCGIYIMTRLLFCFIYRRTTLLWWHYGLWCMGEMIAASFFLALYMSLVYRKAGGMPYFDALEYCIKMIFIMLVPLYTICILSRIIVNKNKVINMLRDMPQDNTLAKFYDYGRRLKLTITPSAIVYVSAEANYVKIHYIENEKLRSFTLRNSMKSIENLKLAQQLVRCHRSYFVNPRHVKLLGKGNDGIIYAEFLLENVPKIPVSKQYYDVLTNAL